jgi:hypothetical protein
MIPGKLDVPRRVSLFIKAAHPHCKSHNGNRSASGVRLLESGVHGFEVSGRFHVFVSSFDAGQGRTSHLQFLG